MKMVYSNWRQDLTEVMTDKDDNKKVTEKNIKNKIKINPTLGEAIEAMGGELIDMVEMMDPQQEKEKQDPKEKKISQVKKQVLMKKMQAVRQGAGADIVAHYEPEGEQIEEKKGCSHTHEGEECPVHGKKECPNTVAAKVDEAVYGGTPEKKKDTRMTVTAADKKANTPAYQKFKAGDKRYKAADHMEEGVLDAALETDKKMGELHKKVDKDVKRMKAGKKFKEEVELDERTRYAKETGKDFKTGNPSEKGGTRTGKSAFDQVSRQMRKTGGVMSSRGKAIQPQGKKKEPGKKGYKGVTPVDKIRNRLAQKKRAQAYNPYKPRAGESD
jgi:hypothetical protein|tara:strand:+ start:414 stop:1397 length:984 start_codon:yes stop_codon:yes gene_type:complete